MPLPLCLPDNLTPEAFLRDYWQKKPLLIKQGLSALAGMFEPEDILGLALEPEATARLITQQQAEQSHNWTVKNSPLLDNDLDNLPALWTLLVQNLEQWSPELGSFWQAFDFIPQWQRDDIMVSYAPKGGSVGKHYDDYDVFLAQGFGSRRWQLGEYCNEDTEFMPDQPIRLLNDIGDVIFDEILNAGDVLYVPPKLAHFGVAVDDCVTFSFGCRRPNLMQVLDSLVDVVTTDPAWFVPLSLKQSIQSSGKLQSHSIQQIKEQLLLMLQSEQGSQFVTQAISETVSRRQYDILTSEETLDLIELRTALDSGATLEIDYNSRIIYTESAIDKTPTLYINGQYIQNMNTAESLCLQKLANGYSLQHDDLKAVELEHVMQWLENGWVWLNI